jgi:hypothetical protein
VKEVNKLKDEFTELMYDRYGNFIGRYAAGKVAEKEALISEKDAIISELQEQIRHLKINI